MSDVLNSADRRKTLLFQKVGIFIDAENIEMSSLKHHEGRTDYKKLIESVGDREVLRILYYKPVYKDISQTFELFWKALGGEIRRPAKNADSFLIIDAVTMAEKLDVAIIVGGDKDYLPLVWYLKSRGCRVEIWSWPESTSPEVREAADVYFPLTKDFVIPPEETRNPKLRGDSQSQPQSRSEPGRAEPAAEAPAKAAQAATSGGGGGRGGAAAQSQGRAQAQAPRSSSSRSSPPPRSESSRAESRSPAERNGGRSGQPRAQAAASQSRDASAPSPAKPAEEPAAADGSAPRGGTTGRPSNRSPRRRS